MLIADRLIAEKIAPVVVDRFWMIEATEKSGESFKVGGRKDTIEEARYFLEGYAKPRNKKIKHWRIVEITTTERVVE